MGMYTEILVKIDFNKVNINKNNLDILKYMFEEYSDIEKEELVLPNFDFFKCDRWGFIGRSSSFYHHPTPINSWYEDENWVYIFSRSDFKNYDNEIDKFFDWLRSLNLVDKNTFIGYSLYEESNTPHLYYQ
jgi:hypothetical protein